MPINFELILPQAHDLQKLVCGEYGPIRRELLEFKNLFNKIIPNGWEIVNYKKNEDKTKIKMRLKTMRL